MLEELYRTTNGAQWRRSDNWCSSLPVEEWFGIEAEDGWVTKIDLRNNNLRGPLPESIGELDRLEYLHIQYNSISGEVPGSIAAKIGGLQQICAHQNSLHGHVPETLALNADLQLLLLHENQFTGPFDCTKPAFIFILMPSLRVTGADDCDAKFRHARGKHLHRLL
jgi:hypothetical protein